MLAHSLMAVTLTLLYFLSLFIPLSLSALTMEASEREALFSVMESMSSDRDWRSSNPDPCEPGSSWPGIECKQGKDSYFHVTRLDFGPSPNPNCLANASFPSLIFTLPFLQSLFFVDCFKDTKTVLSFPPLNRSSSNSYSSLQQLSVRSNSALTGSIPTEISAFKSLQVLTLSQNHLSGKIPDSISSISSLIHLDLSYNSLTGTVPAQIGQLSNLAGLDLSYNSLSGQIPKSIGDLNQLQKLDLSSNKLTGMIPESVRNMLSGIVPFNPNFVKRLGRNLDLSGNTGLCINGSDGYYASARVGVGTCRDDRTGTVENLDSGGNSIRVLGFDHFGVFHNNLIGLLGLNPPPLLSESAATQKPL
ncbi:hypothetical protein LUZ60_000503 [Juncus effusus]|nr:hypothetical protein LUZ60_000503 [Juncus effusus]